MLQFFLGTSSTSQSTSGTIAGVGSISASAYSEQFTSGTIAGVGSLSGVATGAYTDTFTDTAGTSLTSHAPDAGGSWSVVSGGTAGVITAANRLRFGVSSASSSLFIHSPVSSTADYAVSADVYPQSVASSYGAGVIGRYDSGTDSGYFLRYAHGSTAIQLLRRVSGTFSGVLASSSYTATAGVTFRLTLDMSGSTIRGLKDGVQVISYSDATPVTGAGKAGVGIAGTGTISDSFGLHVDDFSGVSSAPTDQPTSGTIAGTGTISASASATFETSGTIAGAGSIAASATATCATTATIAGVSSLAASAITTQYAAGTIAGVGSISAIAGGTGPPVSSFPDPFAATSTTAFDPFAVTARATLDPFAATTSAAADPFAATARYKGS